MAVSNAEKQAARQRRLRKGGLVHVQSWCRPDQAEAIYRILADQAVDYRPLIRDTSQEPPEARSAEPLPGTVTHHQISAPITPEPAPDPFAEPKTPEKLPEKPTLPVTQAIIRKWRKMAEDRAPAGLSAIVAHLREHTRVDELWTVRSLHKLMKPSLYEVAVGVEIWRLRAEGKDDKAIVAALNAMDSPAPDGKHWTAAKMRGFNN